MKTSAKFIKILSVLLVAALLVPCFAGCGKKGPDVLIYTSAEDYRVAYLKQRLAEKFPNYTIEVEYMSTGTHAAKLQAEGTDSDCDISHSLDFGYYAKLDAAGVLADLSGYDKSIYMDDTRHSENYIIELRNSGGIIINSKVLEQKGLAKPTSYQDLLKPEYKGLISMPNPKASGTGYMFLKCLVNAWGEAEAFNYFEKLSANVQDFTSSGSGPVQKLLQGEVAIGLGMTAQAVTEINNGASLEILFFAEGAPFSLYGQSIVKGKETDPKVKEVFDFLVNEYNYENNEKFFPEQVYKDKTYTVKNYPTNIPYGDMKNNTIEEKERLLDKWVY
ncbi:MAG: extracellular solute-binding protein [Oscillospiraceae bacterium]|nr:extracellular solute-binding protein [Oscillospiraceae bacterium]